ncbi:hypothetical protein B0H16DRAFT_1695192 [Mycena metata]|uniref:Nephrocystin 3-like N-terminal domain-containing protein n=1 Tax=Mycena metata TaxID=1033252 RepID=A0AAD7I9B9_9AGAR|nr:hypothetical protein B0H16DRAFT_1695192 [Mycena metata]
MFSNGAGFQINGGNFFDISGDMNMGSSHRYLVPIAEVDWEQSTSKLEAPLHIPSSGAGRVARSTNSLNSFYLPVKGSSQKITAPPLEDLTSASRASERQPDAHSPHGLNDMCRIDDGRYNGRLDGATFITTANVNHTQRSGEAGMHILHRTVVLEALHDSSDNFPQPRCNPETRLEILRDLYEWALENDPIRSICWLYGPAGAGKTAIMHTLSQDLQDKNHLAGAFFFKRGHPTRGNAKLLFATLTYQLALCNPRLKDHISGRVEEDPSVLVRGMDAQLRVLIDEPSSHLQILPPAKARLSREKYCLSSAKPSNDILRHFGFLSPAGQKLLFGKLSPRAHSMESFPRDIEQAFEDVRTYLLDQFARIRREHSHTMSKIAQPWPSPHIIDTLVAKSSGYFIYASTVIKLRAILCAVAHLDLNSAQIEQLLDLEAGDVQLILRGVHSVLDMPYPHKTIAVYHASFLDFLRDQRRSSHFHVAVEDEMTLATAVLGALSYVQSNKRNAFADPHISWFLSHRDKWIEYIISLPPLTELVPHIKLLNPDYLWETFAHASSAEQVNKLLSWLKAIQPNPADIIQIWEDYYFMGHQLSKNELPDLLGKARKQLELHCSERAALSPSLSILRTLESAGTFDVSIDACRDLLAQSPQLVRIFQARTLLNTSGNCLSETFSLGLFHFRILLDISWDDMRAAVCLLRTVPRTNIGSTLVILRTVCQELYDDLVTPKDLAFGFLRLIKRIGAGELPLIFWRYFMLTPSGPKAEWDRHVRCSPKSPELLHELHGLVPRWDVFSAEHLSPIEFYDVVRWLEAFDDPPPLETLTRWRGYLTLSRDRYPDKYSDDELERRWVETADVEALRSRDEGEVLQCWSLAMI